MIVFFYFFSSVKTPNIFGVNEDVFMNRRIKFTVLPTSSCSPIDNSHEIRLAKNFIGYLLKISTLIIVNRNKDNAVVA